MTEILSVETESTNLVLEGKSQARFELGVCMALYLWENLATAVDNQWGGGNSEDKRDWMAGAVVELFETSNYVDSEDIEDRILGIMEDEFGVAVEDSTAGDVADQIIHIYQQCAQNNFSLVDELYAKYQSKSASKNIVNVEEGHDEVDDYEDVDEEDEASHALSENKHPRPEPIIDDDGFELVQKKR